MAPIPGKAYLSLIMSDGDNLQAWLSYFPRYWQARGDLPVGWTVGPLAVELMPDVLDWVARRRVPGDYFLAAVSGVGYVYLEHYGAALADPAAAKEAFLALTEAYMRRLGLTMIWPMAAHGSVPEEMLRLYASRLPALSALFPDYAQRVARPAQATRLLRADGRPVPVFHALGAGNQSMGLQLRDALQSLGRPAFVHAFVLNWSYPSLQGLAESLRPLPPDAVLVRPDQLVRLYLAYLGLRHPTGGP